MTRRSCSAAPILPPASPAPRASGVLGRMGWGGKSIQIASKPRFSWRKPQGRFLVLLKESRGLDRPPPAPRPFGAGEAGTGREMVSKSYWKSYRNRIQVVLLLDQVVFNPVSKSYQNRISRNEKYTGRISESYQNRIRTPKRKKIIWNTVARLNSRHPYRNP